MTSKQRATRSTRPATHMLVVRAAGCTLQATHAVYAVSSACCNAACSKRVEAGSLRTFAASRGRRLVASQCGEDGQIGDRRWVNDSWCFVEMANGEEEERKI